MFLDCTPLIADNSACNGLGMAVADIDGDGAFEILVTGYGESNRVLKWTGSALVEVTPPQLADPGGLAVGVAAGDIDGDGREEIYIVNSDKNTGARREPDRLFAAFGNHWLDLLAQAKNVDAAPTAPACSVACIDRRGHGRYGFVVATEGAPFALLELERDGKLVDVAEDIGIDLSAHGRGLLTAPLLSDHMDIVASNEKGPNFLFRNLGDGTFEDVAAKRGIADAHQSGRGLALVDVAGDGLFDLVCANWQGSQRLFVQRPGGVFVDAAHFELSMPGRMRSVVVGDFDNDGFQEILFLGYGEPNRLFAWRHDVWTETDPADATESHAFSTGAVVGDFDGDGRLEVLINHCGHSTAPLTLFRTAPNHNSWLRVLPLTAAGAPARGAVVTCVAGKRSQRRVVCAGSGYLCQMEPVAHFGLGSATAVERVEVRWPNGLVAEIERPPLGRVLTVSYPPK
ncbi:enediyne biosynthesis protein E4 [uncultured Gammaproteobacteria bacterium]